MSYGTSSNAKYRGSGCWVDNDDGSFNFNPDMDLGMTIARVDPWFAFKKVHTFSYEFCHSVLKAVHLPKNQALLHRLRSK